MTENRIIIGFRVVGIACLLFYIFLNFAYMGSFGFDVEKMKGGDLGTWGDFVGGMLNPIVSILAFWALLYTIKQQGRELRSSTDQLKASADALVAQNKHWELQAFEGKFFNLITHNSNIFNSISDRQKNSHKNQSMSVNVFRLLGAIESDLAAKGGVVGDESIDCFLNINKEILDSYFGDELNPYIPFCDSVVLIVRFVDDAKVLDKDFYLKLFRSQIEFSALIMVLFYCINNFSKTNKFDMELFKRVGFFDGITLSSSVPFLNNLVKGSCCSINK